MANTVYANKAFENTLLERLSQSDRFRIYQDAFRITTGLPLQLISADPDIWTMEEGGDNRSPFCLAINNTGESCEACAETNRELIRDAESKGPVTCECFAGLRATAVPVKMGASVIGFLKTGQVFTEPPTEDQFTKVVSALGRKTLTEGFLKQLKDAYLATRSVDPQRYEGMVVLLQTFADQLGQYVESLAIIEEGDEPSAVARARRFIHSNVDQPLPLSEVAREAGLSESHFCRLFKDSTGLTLTDYINRCRIDWAKRELLCPETRISEVAFNVGYQSLSQFNRSFVRIAGITPTKYRRTRTKRSTTRTKKQ